MRDIVIVIPCRDEAPTIAGVIESFRAVCPSARVVVVDNASNDGTALKAAAAGAVVLHQRRVGKGWAVQSALESLSADALVLVDGDGTYAAADLPSLLAVSAQGADMVVGRRARGAGMAVMNRIGNAVISASVNLTRRTAFEDVLSGYRVLSRRACAALVARAEGFDIEVDLTLRALALGLTIREVPVSYRARPSGSRSKLRPLADGWRILRTVARHTRPGSRGWPLWTGDRASVPRE